MFPEYRDQIAQLKLSDLNFVRLFEKHNALDQKIRHMEAHIEPGTHEEIEQLKKEKLLIKDALYDILKKTNTVKD
ncbi:YdcH family protein [Rhodoferax sp.]|uniref:YdcH family protein n=1 Tax=Rhodoferax sp. TaxID=50421 RepID=UPI0025EFAACC|nr:YdcH family protein [Rhodoferax sp.]MCM2341418.1 YdcH family protein [Rhodoferax sp.]